MSIFHLIFILSIDSFFPHPTFLPPPLHHVKCVNLMHIKLPNFMTIIHNFYIPNFSGKSFFNSTFYSQFFLTVFLSINILSLFTSLIFTLCSSSSPHYPFQMLFTFFKNIYIFDTKSSHNFGTEKGLPRFTQLHNFGT